MFSEYRAAFNKSYANNPHEIFNRYEQFKANLNYVNKHNREAALGLHTYTVAMNQWADMSNAEYTQIIRANC